MRISKKLIAQTCLPVYKELLEKGRKDNRDRFYVRLKNKKSEKGICLLYSVNNKIGDIYVFQPLKSKLSYNSEGRFDVEGEWFYNRSLFLYSYFINLKYSLEGNNYQISCISIY